MTRELEPRLFTLIKRKMDLSKPATAAIAAKDFRQIMVYAAEALVGTREATGHNDGEIINLIQDTVGGHSGEPYCIGGVQTCIAFAEEITGQKSPLIATELATGLWAATPKSLRVNKIPLPGAIAIWQNVRAGKKLSSGHGEIVRSAANTVWYGVGFNTSGSSFPGGPIVREGNGVYFTTRNYEDRATRILLGFIKPI